MTVFVRSLHVCVLTIFFQIEAFNQEEEAFGWQTTAYPQRQQIMTTMKPYLSLYETTVEFNNKYKYAHIYFVHSDYFSFDGDRRNFCFKYHAQIWSWNQVMSNGG